MTVASLYCYDMGTRSYKLLGYFPAKSLFFARFIYGTEHDSCNNAWLLYPPTPSRMLSLPLPQQVIRLPALWCLFHRLTCSVSDRSIKPSLMKTKESTQQTIYTKQDACRNSSLQNTKTRYPIYQQKRTIIKSSKIQRAKSKATLRQQLSRRARIDHPVLS